jgi:hypothetical protein
MKDRKIKNVAASVRQRLQNIARSSRRPFQEVLQYYAMERFLYRLSQSTHADRFVLKGALMFNVWRAPTSRPTKDIDLLGHMESNVEALAAVMRDVCSQPVEADGIVFDPHSVQGMLIKEDADYEGVRVTFRGSLENARIPMQIDIGFGDVMFPGPEVNVYPTILDYAPPTLRGYSRETSVAEKFEAMVKLGLLNSRMKDFYDIWVLSRQFDFDGIKLATAIEKTFSHRGTTVVASPAALTPAFATDPAKVTQWDAFVRKSRLTDVPTDLAAVVEVIAAFLNPPATAIAEGRSFSNAWMAPGPWHA